MKKVALLGSTGSIGVNTLEVISAFPEKFKVVALSANSNVDLVKEQIEKFHPEIVSISNRESAEKLRAAMPDCNILSGEEGLIEIAANCDYDIFVGAMVGFSGLAPTTEAIKRGKRIALANKETLVVAGAIITELVAKHNAELIPVDSEHSAIFQCLLGESVDSVSKLILTASGGPFLNRPKEDFSSITLAEALNHPNWKMGNKITIDSATMMNKGLEIIEAFWLFNMPMGKIDVVIHPQSIVHSMVEFTDGSVKAQLSTPDMKLPIMLALGYPERLNKSFTSTNLPLVKNLSFFEPDFDKFECLKLAFDVLESGGTSPCILNAANEVAVSRFLNGEIKFSRIPGIIKKSLDSIPNSPNPGLDEIFECNSRTRSFASQIF
ncbi:MAG: 1-deoxy-D-xylulose-5-phosphate reductoisomerase [Ignavibacteriaceae bacterium]